MQIRNKLGLAFFAMVTFPMVFIATVSYYTAKTAIRNEVISAKRLVADGLEGQILEYLESCRQRAIFIADGSIVQSMVARINSLENPVQKKAAGHQLSEYLGKNKKPLDADIINIHVLDPSGREIAGIYEDRLGSFADKDQPYFINGLHATYIQTPFTHVHVGVEYRFLPVATPVKSLSDNKTIGVLMVGFDINVLRDIITGERNQRFRSLMTQQDTFAGADIDLIDNDGTFVVNLVDNRPIETQKIVLKTEPVGKCLEQGDNISGEWTNFRGKKVWGASMCLQPEHDWRWVLIVKKEVSVAIYPIIRLRNLMALLLVVTLVVFGLIAHRLANSISKPIHELQMGAEIIGKGNLEHRVGTATKDEIGTLSRAIDRMTANLKEITASRNDLDREMDERKKAEIMLEATLLDVERSNKELEQFAYIASHDLQEPLRMVASYVQLLEQEYGDRLDGEAGEYLNYAVDGARRMQVMINGLLAYSRVDTRGMPMEMMESSSALDDALDNLKIAIDESSAVIDRGELPRVLGDPSQLMLLFQNLIGNAIKYRSEAAPHLRISARREKGEWVFSVQDNGIGFNPKYTDRIFKIFQRLHTRSKYDGSGIGLAICKKIVERHNGRIWAESEPGKGSIFSFSLPATTVLSKDL